MLTGAVRVFKDIEVKCEVLITQIKLRTALNVNFATFFCNTASFTVQWILRW